MTPEELKRFVGRKNTFSLQTDDGGYIPQRRDITVADLVAHLNGYKTLGVYVIREDGLVNYSVIDIDISPDDLELSEMLGKWIMEQFPDFDRVLEFSGRRGHHIWLFPEQPEPAVFLKELVKSRLRKKGLKDIEVFPKQDRLTKENPLGNLIKLPCGKHKKGGWSKILEERKAGEP